MYTDYFGFLEPPFNVTPDSRFFYSNDSYAEAYATLLYGIYERRGLVVLTGEVGTGKTTLLHRLMTNLDPTIKFAFIYNTVVDFDELLVSICKELDIQLETASRLEQIEKLNEFLVAQLKKGGTVALLIDEAQNLDEEVLERLRLLSNFETQKEKLLQIVLVGQPELEKKLSQTKLRQLRQRVALQYRLGYLNDREVRAFIDHRLKIAGSPHRNLFSPSAVQSIIVYSEGIPRLVNIICGNALLVAYATGQKTIRAHIIEEVAADLRLKKEGELTRRSEISDGWSLGAQQDHMVPMKKEPWTLEPRFKSHMWRGAVLGLLLLGTTGLAASTLQLTEPLGELKFTIQGAVETAWAHLGSYWPGLESEPSVLSSGSVERTFLDEPPVQGELVVSSDRAEPNLGRQETVDPIFRVPQPMSLIDKNNLKPLIVQAGSTISGILFNVYGTQHTLALDIVKEFNSQIQNINQVRVGEKLWLPPLTLETLLRKQADGSYRLILASFYSSSAAEVFARELGQQQVAGVVITPHRIETDILLYRVEVKGLTDLEAARQVWAVAGVS